MRSLSSDSSCSLARSPFRGYYVCVKPRGLLRAACNLLIAGFIFASFAAAGQTRTIRLRTGFITTPPASKITAQSQAAAIQSPVSGLYLIQFEDTLQPAERAQLQALGVKLLKYVPDDAFIARLDNVSPASVKALGFVRWMGTYQPDYKIESRLSAAAGGALLNSQAQIADV